MFCLFLSFSISLLLGGGGDCWFLRGFNTKCRCLFIYSSVTHFKITFAWFTLLYFYYVLIYVLFVFIIFHLTVTGGGGGLLVFEGF